MPRLGLCCTFAAQPIKFGNTTVSAVSRMSRADALAKLAKLCEANAAALLQALKYCAASGIGCFRVNSQILPIKTHPVHGYDLTELPGGATIREKFEECGRFAREHSLRTCFHPDQFVVLNSLKPEIVASSLRELEYQAEVAEWIGADVINIHGGGAFGDKPDALRRFTRALDRLSDRARSRLTVENDDRTYTPTDLLAVCRETSVPLVYDVHHHRCLSDGLSVEEATKQAITTWNREPLFHISSPLEGWDGPQPHRHHDHIAPADFPDCWRSLDITIEVEAKAKELAVERLRQSLAEVVLTTPTVPAVKQRRSARKVNS